MPLAALAGHSLSSSLPWLDGTALHALHAQPLQLAALHPGDTLYIPPYWIHAVHSATDSANLGVVSSAYEQDMTIALAREEPPAFRLATDRCESAHLLGGYLTVQVAAPARPPDLT